MLAWLERTQAAVNKVYSIGHVIFPYVCFLYVVNAWLSCSACTVILVALTRGLFSWRSTVFLGFCFHFQEAVCCISSKLLMPC